MTQHLDSIAGFVSTVTAAIVGAVSMPAVAQIATGESLPPWATWVLGPLGALVGMMFAIRWLTARLDKQEQKFDAREAERDADRKTLIGVLAQNSLTLEQNSTIMREVKDVLTDREP